MKLTKLEVEVLRKLSRGCLYWMGMSPRDCATVTRLMRKQVARWVEGGLCGRRIATITPAGRAYLATLDKEDKP